MQSVMVRLILFASTGLALAGSTALSGCVATPPHPGTAERELTAGIVQRAIRRGMSQADVAAALGSPNIVTRDTDGRESWIYDRIATTAEYRHDSYAVGAGGGGAGGGDTLLLGVIAGALGSSSGYTSSTQRSLTVIVKFDTEARVETFSFHQTRF